jgi:hypothetical protein
MNFDEPLRDHRHWVKGRKRQDDAPRSRSTGNPARSQKTNGNKKAAQVSPQPHAAKVCALALTPA